MPADVEPPVACANIGIATRNSIASAIKIFSLMVVSPSMNCSQGGGPYCLWGAISSRLGTMMPVSKLMLVTDGRAHVYDRQNHEYECLQNADEYMQSHKCGG